MRFILLLVLEEAGSLDPSNMFNIILTRRIACIRTSLDEYRQNIEKDGLLKKIQRLLWNQQLLKKHLKFYII